MDDGSGLRGVRFPRLRTPQTPQAWTPPLRKTPQAQTPPIRKTPQILENIWVQSLRNAENWALENWAPENWALENWAPENWAPGKLGTGKIGHQENWAPENWAPGKLGTTNWAPTRMIRVQFGNDDLAMADFDNGIFGNGRFGNKRFSNDDLAMKIWKWTI